MKNRNILFSIFPFLRWFPYRFSSFKHDAIAGITVALVLIPQSMAYAQLSGMPPHYGLYAALIPCVVGALWGDSPFIATGPVAITSLLTVVTLQPYAAVETAEFIELAILLALMVGCIRLLVGAFRLSFFINFISLPVIRGFTNACAVIIALSQLDKLFGLEVAAGPKFLYEIFSLFQSMGDLHLLTFLFGLAAIGILIFIKKKFSKLPGSLIVVAIIGMFVFFLKRAGVESSEGITIVGDIPAGLPRFQLPVITWERFVNLLPGAVMVSFIGFMEVSAISKTLGIKSGRRVNLNQEFIGQGLSCIAGSMFRSFPTSTSFSRSALSYDSKAETGINSLITGGVVLATVLFLTGILGNIPQTVLGAVIIVSVFGIFDLSSIITIWKISVMEGVASIITFLATIYFAPNMIYGIFVGAGLAIVLHLYKTMKPRMVVLGKHVDGTMRDVELHVLNVDEKNIHIRYDGRIYFASAPHFEESLFGVLERFPKADHVIIYGEGINEVDATGLQMLRDVIMRLQAIGISITFTGLKYQVHRNFVKTGITDLVGKDRIIQKEE